MIRRRTTHAVTWLTASAIMLAGCTGANVDEKTETEAKALVQQYADQVSALIGSRLEEPTLSSSACSGKGGESDRQIFSIQGAYQIAVPTEQQTATFNRVRDAWKANGYTITDDRTIKTNDGVLAAKTPDGVDIDIETTRPPTAVALLIHSPCFKSPTPRD